MMDFEPFLSDLAQLFSVEIGELTDEFVLDTNKNFDSLAIISMMALMDDHFGCEISGEELRNCKNLGQVLRIIESSKES